MKRIVTEETVVQKIITYIACDGSSFTTERECFLHELNLQNNQLEKDVDKLTNIYYQPPFSDDSGDWRWFYVKTSEDVQLVCKYYNTINNSNDIEFNGDMQLPTWICVETTDDDYCYSWADIECYSKEFANMLDELRRSAK